MSEGPFSMQHSFSSTSQKVKPSYVPCTFPSSVYKASKGKFVMNLTELYRDKIFKSPRAYASWTKYRGDTGCHKRAQWRTGLWFLHLEHEKLLCRLNKWRWNTGDKTVWRKSQFTVLSLPVNILTFKNSLALWICCQVASVFTAEKNFKFKHSRAVLRWVWRGAYHQH